MPLRLMATRVPGSAVVCLVWWVWMPRTRPRKPAGRISISSPTCKGPSSSVPVTTVPKPPTEKARSIGKRGTPAATVRVGTSSSKRSSAWSNSAMPAPVRAETGTIGAKASTESRKPSRTSSIIKSRHSASTRSHLVNTISACSMPSKSIIWRCSMVCGWIPSSAAITNKTASKPPTPANIFLMKRS